MTDGGYARVRELGFIDLFVVTSLKMNQLQPNFERKSPITYGILIILHYDLPFPFYCGRNARKSSGWPTAIVKCCWCLDLFLAAYLGGLLANRHQTLFFFDPELYKIWSYDFANFWLFDPLHGPLEIPKFGENLTTGFSARWRQRFFFDPKYLANPWEFCGKFVTTLLLRLCTAAICRPTADSRRR